MTLQIKRSNYIFLVILSSLFVYLFGHYESLINQYVINDDVRQQIYWMQRWLDHELFQNDLLTRYAENYVPIGVKSIYHAFSGIMNPVQFSKILTGLLFVVNALLLFIIGTRFTDDLTAFIITVCSFLFTSFIAKMSGGMSQSFAYPLLFTYLYFLASKNLLGASLTIMIQSIFNPYIFVLCFATHSLYLLWNLWGYVALTDVESEERVQPEITLSKLILMNIPVLVGVLSMIIQHVYLRTTEFGDLISWVDIYGNIEYTSSGRYQLVPGPDLYWELFRPVVLLLLFDDYGPVAGTISAAVGLIIVLWAVAINKWDLDISKMSFLVYLVVASLTLYFISYEVIMRLFLPRRYVEFSFNLIYVIILGACVSSIVRSLDLRVHWLAFLLVAVLVSSGLRIHNVGIYDYSKDARLYEFLSTTPKNSTVAGPPEVIDNVVTFAKRKGFVTFELSHTWFTEYWRLIKKRTVDLFKAYYSDDPDIIRDFAEKNGINYIIVRDRDYYPQNISKTFDGFEPFGSVERSTASAINEDTKPHLIYFEPFQSFIRARYQNSQYFALLDESQFKPVFKGEGYRVIKLR